MSYAHLFDFVDDEAHTTVKVLGQPARRPFRPLPEKVLIDVGGEYRTLDEFVHKCPCCGSETEIRP